MQTDIQEILIYLTQKCNYSCKMCTQSGLKQIENLDLEKWDKIFQSISQDFPNSMIIFLGGEPTLHKDFYQILELTKKYHLYKQHVVTNGSFLLENLHKLKKNYCGMTISIDGLRNTHDKIRNSKGAYDRTVSAIKEMYKRNKTILEKRERYFYGINYVMLPENIDETEDFVKEFIKYNPKDITLNHVRFAPIDSIISIEKQMKDIFPEIKTERHLMTRQTISFSKEYVLKMNEVIKRAKSISPLVKEFPDFTEQERIDYYDEEKIITLKPDLICPSPYKIPTILPDGTVLSCLYNKLGNILETPLSVLWQNEIANRTRLYLDENKKFLACSRCTCRYKITE
jgi:MoaA/NifB/PqqE/SkfB family radical SAM enzyme